MVETIHFDLAPDPGIHFREKGLGSDSGQIKWIRVDPDPESDSNIFLIFFL